MRALNILIVEDNEDHLFFIKKALSNNYYNLKVITNGKEAYNYLLNPEIEPDVILLDSHLPEISGLEILKKLKSKKLDYGIILTTVDPYPDIYVKAMKYGAEDLFLKKPEYLYTLTQKIEKVHKFHQSKLQKKEIEANFNSIINSNDDDIYAIDTNYRLTAFNNAFKKTILRLANCDVKIGDSILTIFKSNNEIWKPRYDRVLKGEKLTFEFSHKKDKLSRFYEVRLSPIIIDKVIVGLSGMGSDITEHKKIAKDLFNKNQLIEKHLNNTPLAGIYMDINMNVLDWNLAAEKIFGYSKQEVFGKNLFELVAPKDIIKDDQNNITGISCLVEDVTNRLKTEENLKQSENKFREIFEKSGDAILIIKNGIFVECNDATISLLKYKSKETFLNTHPSVLSPDFQPNGKDSFTEAEKMMQIALKKGTHRFEWLHTKKNKENFPVEVLLTAISNEPNNKIIHCVWRDITERKQFELELKDSEKRLLEAQKITHLGTFVFDDKINLFKTSAICDTILGIDANYKKDIQGWINFIHPGDYLEIQEILDNNSIKTIFKEIRIIRPKDKKVIWVLSSVVKEFNKKGIRSKITGTIQDITERKQLENNLFEKNQFFEKILDKTPLAFIYFDIDSIIKRWNPAAEIIFGYSAKEAIGKNIMDLIVPKKIQESIEKVRDDIFDEIGVQVNQNENITKSGKRIVCNWYNTEIKDENNKVIGLSSLVENITERKKIEEELFEKEQQMSSIYNTVNDIIFYLSIEGDNQYKFTSVNKAFAKAVGLPKKSIIGKLVKEIIPEPSLSLVLEKYKEAITKKTIISWEETTPYPEGNKIKYKTGEVSVSPIFDNNGVCTHLVGSVHDITNRIESSKKINESNEFLINTLESMTDAFISLDKNWEYTYVNKKAGEMFGRNPEDLIGKNIWTEFPEGIDQPFYKNYYLAVQNNIPLVMEDYYAPWDKWFENRIVPSKNGLAVFFHDVSEKKKAIEKIKIQNKQLLDIQNIAKLGSFDVDLNTQTSVCSFIFKVITGFKANEIINFDYWHEVIVHPDDVEDNKKIIKNCISTGSKFDREYRIYTKKTKKLKWLHGLGEIIYKNNKATNFIGTIQDITVRKRNEITKEIIFNITKKASGSHNLTKLFNFIKIELSKLIDTNNFFIALYNETTNMIGTPYIVDELDNEKDFPKGKTLTGYIIDTKKALLAIESDFKRLVKAKKIDRIGPNAACWLGVPLIVDNKVIGAMVIQSYTNVDAYAQEDVALVELIAANISQSIKLSQDLEQIRLLNHALIQSPESILVTNIKGNIQYVNPAFTQLSGYKLDEVLGKNPRFLKTDIKDKIFYKNLWKTILSGKTWNGEFVNKHKNGTKYLVDASISSVKNREGEITHFVGVEVDITEKRKLEHDFLHALIDAQEIEKQSFGEELHDGISQILSAQTMFVDVLKKLTNKSEGKIQEYLDKVKDLNLKAIDETRSIAHGLMSKQLKENGLILAVKHICIDYSESRDVNFLFSCKGLIEDEIEFQIKSNTFRIIQEVATNTVRHSLAKEAKISLSKTTKNQLKIILKDNGVGMDFERMKKNKKGAGIENIKRRVALLNGSVDIKTELNKGTQYSLLIPLKSIN